MKVFVSGMSVVLLAVAVQARFVQRAQEHGVHSQTGGTAIGGPSGNDGGQSFSAPIAIDSTNSVTEDNEDNHSLGLKHEEIDFLPPVPGLAPFRRSEDDAPPFTRPQHKHFEPHPEPHYENHPEPHVVNHPEPHYDPQYSPSYEPHYEPHTHLEDELTAIKNVNNAPAAGAVSFGRRKALAGPESHSR